MIRRAYYRVALFLGIVFREWDGVRLWPRLAWSISKVVWTKPSEPSPAPPDLADADRAMCEAWEAFDAATKDWFAAGGVVSQKWLDLYSEFGHWEDRRQVGL